MSNEGVPWENTLDRALVPNVRNVNKSSTIGLQHISLLVQVVEGVPLVHDKTTVITATTATVVAMDPSTT